MSAGQESNSVKKRTSATIPQRIAAAIVFFAILGIFATLLAAAQGLTNLNGIFGVCGFKQSYGLPCPGCYITTSAIAFVRGQILESFYTQPAGTVLCLTLIATAIVAFLIAACRKDFDFLHRPKATQLIKYFIVSLLIILAAAWAVTLARTIAEAGTVMVKNINTTPPAGRGLCSFLTLPFDL